MSCRSDGLPGLLISVVQPEEESQMNSNARHLWLGLVLISAVTLLTDALPAHASWSYNTRKKCRALSKQYVASTAAGCWEQPSALLVHFNQSSGCGDVTSYADKVCLFGGSWASAFNGPSGHGGDSGHTGSGWAAAVHPLSNPGGGPTANSHATTHFRGTTTFDDANQTITVSIASGRFTATNDSTFSLLEIDAWVARDSTDTLYSASKTFWRGYMRVRNGVVTYADHFSAADFAVTTGGDSTTATIGPLTKVIPFPDGIGSFDNANLRVRGHIGYGLEELTTPPIVPALSRVGLMLSSLVLVGIALVSLPRLRKSFRLNSRRV
jgi:hypothetical protein